MGARLGRGRGARAHAGAERAAASRRALVRGEAAGRADRRARRVARRPRVDAGGARRGPDLAAEPRLAARGARRRLAGRRAHARLCAAPGGKATMLRGEVDRGRAAPGPRARAARRTRAASARRTSASSRRTGASCRTSCGFDRALVDAPCSGLGVLAAPPRPALARASRCPSSSSRSLRAAAERVRPGGTVVYSVCTLNADENEAVVDASGLEVEPLGEEWPQFRTRSGRSSC